MLKLKSREILLYAVVALVVLDQVIKCSAFIRIEFGDFGDKKDDKKGDKKEKTWWEKWTDFWFGEGVKDDDQKLKEGKEKIRYLFRDRKGQGWFEMQKNGSVPEKWSKDSSLKLIIHGYSTGTHHHHDHSKIIREQNILDIGVVYGKQNSSLNIVVVDWTTLAVEPLHRYKNAVHGVYPAGKDVGEFLLKLSKEGHIKDWGRVHLIGFNLGAHVAAVAAKHIEKEKTDTKIGRVTGLDPMGPGFHEADGTSWKNESVSLSKSSAEFVDIIHCNMEKTKDIHEAIIKGRYGSPVQAGHVDFYPNGGSQQKGCLYHEENLEKMCSARKCVEYYASSITSQFVGCSCDDWDYFKGGKCNCTLETDGVLMGDQATPPANGGRYYLRIPKE